MTMYVLIEPTPEGRYTASLIGWPGVKAHGSTEDEALAQLRTSLSIQLQQARIVPFELEPESGENPWLVLSDHFQHNPLLDEVVTAIAEDRSQIDAQSEAA